MRTQTQVQPEKTVTHPLTVAEVDARIAAVDAERQRLEAEAESLRQELILADNPKKLTQMVTIQAQVGILEDRLDLLVDERRAAQGRELVGRYAVRVDEILSDVAELKQLEGSPEFEAVIQRFEAQMRKSARLRHSINLRQRLLSENLTGDPALLQEVSAELAAENDRLGSIRDVTYMQKPEWL